MFGRDDARPLSTSLESLPACVILCILDFLPELDYYNLKLAGSRYITDVIREATTRVPRGKHLQAIQNVDATRRKLKPNSRRSALEIMIERGQSALVLHYKRRYQNLSPSDISRGLKESYTFIPALHWAAYYGSIDILRMLIDRVDVRSSRGWTALHFAARGGQVEAAKILLKHGAEINAMDNRGKTPLDFAVLYNQNLMAEFLKSKEAAPDIKTIFLDIENNWSRVLPLRNQCTSFSKNKEEHLPFKGELGTPNMKALVNYFGTRDTTSERQRKSLQKRIAIGAVANNHYQLLRLLLDDGFGINKHVDSYRRTLLHIAAKDSNIDIIQLLIDRGADLTAADKSNRAAFHRAAMFNREDVVQLFLDSGVPVDIMAQKTITALHDAVGAEDVSMIKYLIQKGAYIEAKAPNTPLQLAVLEMKKESVIALLEAGANTEVLGEDGNTPLLVACRNSDRSEDIIKILLEHGANPNAYNEYDDTALDLYPNELLIKYGADINSQVGHIYSAFSGEIDSPYHNALKKGEIPAPIATDIRGDVHSRDKDGRSPLHLAARHCRVDTMESILSRGASVSAKDNEGGTPLHHAISNFSVIASITEKLEILLSRGADINAQNDAGLTPLSLATKARGVSCMAHILKYNPDVHIADNQGRTALHFAAMYRGFHLDRGFEALLKTGVDVNKKDNDGLTPLFYALDTPDANMVLLLLKYGAEPKVQDKEKRTPLHHAALHLLPLRCANIAKMLMDYGADPNMKDENGRVAAELSKNITSEEFEAIIQGRGKHKHNLDDYCASIE